MLLYSIFANHRILVLKVELRETSSIVLLLVELLVLGDDVIKR